MSIGLMPHIKNQGIVRNFKGFMQGNGHFHSAQIRGKMAAVLPNRLNDGLAYFSAELNQFSIREVL
jgi:hypothetical protein